MSRDQEATAALFKLLTFHGIKIVTCSEGEINELHVGLTSTMNQLFLKDLAKKTHRGMEGRIEKGRSAGGKAYGYKSLKTVDEADRGRLEIVEHEASVIVRIFEVFASGRSPREIVRELNAEGISGPTRKPWRETTLRGHATRRTGILRNDLYVGQRVWNKLRYSRDPVTGKRVSRVRPVEEWKYKNVPELRIVEQDLWDSVQLRLGAIRNSIHSEKIRASEFWKARRPRHLLTGLIHCGECGRSMSAVGSNYLACAAARSGAGCSNLKGARRSSIEAAVLDGLKDRLMAPELVEEFSRAVIAETNSQRQGIEVAHQQRVRELEKITRKLAGLYDAIADGLRTEGLKQQLESLEAQQRLLKQNIAEGPPKAPRLHPNLSKLYREKVADLQGALSRPESRAEAAEILRELIERIEVKADDDGHLVQLTGDIVRLIALPDGQSVPDAFESSVKVVAGARFELTTFRL